MCVIYMEVVIIGPSKHGLHAISRIFIRNVYTDCYVIACIKGTVRLISAG